MDLKQLSRVEVKDADAGTVAAVFSTFDVVDHDGDVTLKGAFTDGQPVRISAYGHMSWKGMLPVGKGTIREVGNEAVLEGQFFLQTTQGRDTFEVVKEMGKLQEWSYSLDKVQAEPGEKDGKRVRIIKAVHVDEVSPVLKGAGIDTRTLAVKGKQLNSELARNLREAGREAFGGDGVYVYTEDYDPDESYAIFYVYPETGGELRFVRVSYTTDGDTVTLADDAADVDRSVVYAPKSQKFIEQAKSVLTDLGKLNTRALEVVTLRATQGKALGTESAELLALVEQEAAALRAVLSKSTTPDDEASELARREFARFVARSQGVTI